MSNEDSKAISRDDLFLLIGSYKNTVEMYMSILEKQNEISASQNKILETQNRILETQTHALHEFNKVTGELKIYINEIKELKTNLNSMCSTNQTALVSAIKGATDKIDAHNLGSVKNHGTTRTRLYVALGSTFGIVGSLITMIYLLISNHSQLKELLKLIAKAVGVAQ